MQLLLELPTWRSKKVLKHNKAHTEILLLAKGPQTGWLKTAALYSPTVVEIGSLQSRSRQDWFLRRALRETLFHAPLAADDSWQSTAFPTCAPVTSVPTPSPCDWLSLSVCVFTWCSPFCVSLSLSPNFPLLIRTPVTLEQRPTPFWYDLILP